MSKVLVIKAHPLTGEVSRSMQVVDTFITAYKEKITLTTSMKSICIHHSFQKLI